MPALLRLAFAVAIATASTPAIAVSQDPSTSSLLRRIEQLERANADLERRVLALESRLKGEQSRGQSAASAAKWRDVSNWRRLRMGMSMDDVRAVLGDPERVDAGTITWWHWPEGYATFHRERLDGWSEPRR